MKLSIATNFDNELIEQVKDYPVEELYGKLSKDFIGGGRSSYMLAPVEKNILIEHIAHAKKYNIGFNYLLNASCIDNLETTKDGQKQIRKLLDWLTKIGVTSLTVSTPFLLQTIKKSYPHFRVRISVFACVNNLRKAQYWEEMGADIIALDSHVLNKDFKTLKLLKEKLECEMEILTNGNCLMNCMMAHVHPNLMSHSSQSKHSSDGFVIDHCFLYCQKKKTEEPANYLKSDWIRPEDIHYYEEIGYENFKLVERNIKTEEMVKRVKAYSNRSYDGNLLDLVQGFGFKDQQKLSANSKFNKLAFFFKPTKINMFKLNKIKELCTRKGMLLPLKSVPVYIDNKKLDGFIEPFLKRSCMDLNCGIDCKHCDYYADKVITIDPEFQKDCIQLHKDIDDDIYSGKMWK